jgi:LysM repeat protein
VNQRLRLGQRLRIPSAFRYRVKRGDTLEALAKRFLDDRRRAAYLGAVNGMKGGDKLREGQDLLVPFQHLHRAAAPESLQSVARSYYGDASKARLLAEFNFRSAPMLAKGERLVVPISHVRIRAVRLGATAAPPPAPGKPTPPPAAVPAVDTQKREEELAARVRVQLSRAEHAYKEGNYHDVPAALDKLLTDEEPSEAQLAEIFRLKAFSYVALGMEELAVNAFREVIARAPDLKLDEATVSPKIRAAFAEAKKAQP